MVTENMVAIPSPSIREKVRVTEETFVPDKTDEIRGSTLSVGVDQRVQQVDDQVLDVDITTPSVLLPAGTIEVGPAVDIPPQVGLGLEEPNNVTTPSLCSGPVLEANGGQVSNVPLIVNFDNMFNKSRGNHGVLVCSDLSTDTNQVVEEGELLGSKILNTKLPKNRRAPPRIPFPSLIGPKCMRLAGIINGGGSVPVPVRRRKGNVSIGAAEADSSCSSENSEEQHISSSEFDQTDTMEVSNSVPGFVLEVVLPMANPTPGQSGIQLLMGEHSIRDVEGFLAAREDGGGNVLEAEKLVQIQQDLGVSFNSSEQVPVDRLQKMEERDRSELANWKESNGHQ
jgi:hypothetical protein